MKDASTALATAYKTLLTGLTYNGKTVEVYGLMAPEGAEAPYIILGGWRSRYSGTKHAFGQRGELIVDVVTRHRGAVSRKPASDIADMVTSRLLTAPGKCALSVAGFQVIVCNVESVVDMPELSDPAGNLIIRKIITIFHQLNQA